MPNFIKIFAILEHDHQKTMLEELERYNNLQKLIATLLSARTKDSTVLPIVKELFKKYKTPQDFQNLKEEEIYKIGFYRVKTKNIKKLSEKLMQEFAGKVPNSLTELTSLSGVGRKTANCLLSNAFNVPAIAVDVHVHRISNRLGWVKTKKPEETETELMKLIPKELWNKVNNLFVDHGQRICLPRGPRCEICKISEYCQKKI